MVSGALLVWRLVVLVAKSFECSCSDVRSGCGRKLVLVVET